MFSGSDPVDVLLVGDDPGDALLIRETLAQANEHSRFHLARDGDEALRFLHRQGEFADAPRPGLILLDLNLPAPHGLEILARVKGDPHLRIIPVLVLSSSGRPADVQASYELQANAYIVKPRDFDGLADMVRQIDACFLGLIQPPTNRDV